MCYMPAHIYRVNVQTFFECMYLVLQMLKQPSSALSGDFKMQRLAAQDQEVVAEYEELVLSWINTIDAVLADSSSERFLYISSKFL